MKKEKIKVSKLSKTVQENKDYFLYNDDFDTLEIIQSLGADNVKYIQNNSDTTDLDLF